MQTLHADNTCSWNFFYSNRYLPRSEDWYDLWHAKLIVVYPTVLSNSYTQLATNIVFAERSCRQHHSVSHYILCTCIHDVTIQGFSRCTHVPMTSAFGGLLTVHTTSWRQHSASLFVVPCGCGAFDKCQLPTNNWLRFNTRVTSGRASEGVFGVNFNKTLSKMSTKLIEILSTIELRAEQQKKKSGHAVFVTTAGTS